MHTNHLKAFTDDGKKYYAEEVSCFGGNLWMKFYRDKDANLIEASFVKIGIKNHPKEVGIHFMNGFLYFSSCYVKKPYSQVNFNTWVSYNEQYTGLMDEYEIFLYQAILKEFNTKNFPVFNTYELEKKLKRLRCILEIKFDAAKEDRYIKKVSELSETLISSETTNPETFLELLELQKEGVKILIALKDNPWHNGSIRTSVNKVNKLLAMFL